MQMFEINNRRLTARGLKKNQKIDHFISKELIFFIFFNLQRLIGGY